MPGYFTEENKIVIASTTAAGAAAQTAITSSAIDMAGFDGCVFIIPIGPITAGAVTTAKAQQSGDDAAADDYSDIVGSSVTIADNDDNKLKYIDIYRPGKRYLKCVISRATQDATIGGIVAVQYRAANRPVTQGTNVAGEQHTTPAEGTA